MVIDCVSGLVLIEFSCANRLRYFTTQAGKELRWKLHESLGRMEVCNELRHGHYHSLMRLSHILVIHE